MCSVVFPVQKQDNVQCHNKGLKVWHTFGIDFIVVTCQIEIKKQDIQSLDFGVY